MASKSSAFQAALAREQVERDAEGSSSYQAAAAPTSLSGHNAAAAPTSLSGGNAWAARERRRSHDDQRRGSIGLGNGRRGSDSGNGERRGSIGRRELYRGPAIDESNAISFKQLAGAATQEEDDTAVAEAEAEIKAGREAEANEYASVLHLEVPSLLLYLLLVALLSAVLILGREGSLDYWLAEMVRESVLNSELDPADTEVATTFDDVGTLEDVYRFLRGPLLAALYVETTAAGTPLPPGRMRRVNEENVLVGAIRLQQVRSHASTSKGPPIRA